MDDPRDERNDDIMILDTGGSKICTMKLRAWHVIHKTNRRTKMSGYQSKKAQMCPIVNAMTKAKLHGRDEPVLLLVNFATLINDKEEKESLLQPFNLMAHGIKVNMVPQKYGGAQNMIVEDESLEFDFCESEDDSKLFINITKPSQNDLDTLEIFELTSLYPVHHNTV